MMTSLEDLLRRTDQWLASDTAKYETDCVPFRLVRDLLRALRVLQADLESRIDVQLVREMQLAKEVEKTKLQRDEMVKGYQDRLGECFTSLATVRQERDEARLAQAERASTNIQLLRKLDALELKLRSHNP